jgi:cell division septal protein FtsQ
MQPPENADQETLNKWHTLAIQDCDRRILNIERRLADGLNTARERKETRQGHWYTSIAIWFCIMLVLGMLYGIWLLYQQYTGHYIRLPEFLNG